MATFRIDTPDGKSFEITGDHAPSEQELNEMFGGQTTEKEKDYTLGRIATIDRGATFGLGRKVGGVINAIGAAPVDAIMGGQNIKDAFWNRYHEIVDPTMQAMEEYQQDKPIEAFALEIGSGMVNPVNKVGLQYMTKGTNLLSKVGRAGAVGSVTGGVAGGMNTEYVEDLPQNIEQGSVQGAAFNASLPVLGRVAGGVYNKGKALFAPEYSVAGKATGLGNIVKDNDSVRILKRGVMASDDVANQVSEQAPSMMNALNSEMSQTIDKTIGRKLNYENAIGNQQERLGKFVAKNENYPIFRTEKVKSAPSLESFENGLNNFQKKSLRQALQEGSEQSTSEIGTLGATHKAQEVLNDMIGDSYRITPFGQEATTKTRDLMQLKRRFDQMLEPSGVKSLDASFSKAKALKDAFEKGYKFKPSDIKFENLGITSLRDKRAFLQGYLRKIQENVLSDGGTNLADAVRKAENVLKEVLPDKKVASLMETAHRINREFGRVKKLSQLADTTLDKPLAVDRAASERWEGVGAFLGSLKDKASAKMWTNSNRLRALALLNGAKESKNLGTIEGKLKQLAEALGIPLENSAVVRQQNKD